MYSRSGEKRDMTGWALQNVLCREIDGDDKSRKTLVSSRRCSNDRGMWNAQERAFRISSPVLITALRKKLPTSVESRMKLILLPGEDPTIRAGNSFLFSFPVYFSLLSSFFSSSSFFP